MTMWTILSTAFVVIAMMAGLQVAFILGTFLVVMIGIGIVTAAAAIGDMYDRSKRIQSQGRRTGGDSR